MVAVSKGYSKGCKLETLYGYKIYAYVITINYKNFISTHIECAPVEEQAHTAPLCILHE